MTITKIPDRDVPDSADGPRSGISNFRSIVIGRLFSALSTWLALVALTKMSDPATVGTYALAQAICIPIAEVAKMSLREVRSGDAGEAFKFGDYLALRLIAASAGLLIMVSVGIVQSNSVAMLLVMVIYALVRCADLVSDMIYGLFQAHERMEYIGWSLCLVGPLSLLFLVTGYWLTGSLAMAVAGQLAAHLAILSLYDLPLGRGRAQLVGDEFRARWEPTTLYRLASQALPLTFASVLLIVALYFPRFIVEHELGLEGLGLFTAVFALAMAPDRLINAMGVAASVRLSRLFANGRRAAFARLITRLSVGVGACGLIAVAICAWFGEAMLRIIYTDAYAEYETLLVWLVAAAALRGVANILRFGLVAARRYWWLSAKNAISALVSVAGCLVLVPLLGMTGAGVALFAVFAARLVIVVVALTQVLRSPQKSEHVP